jgi:hypothetical protein
MPRWWHIRQPDSTYRSSSKIHGTVAGTPIEQAWSCDITTFFFTIRSGPQSHDSRGDGS